MVCEDAAESPPSMNAPNAELSKAARPRRRSSKVVVADFSASIILFPWLYGVEAGNRQVVMQPVAGQAATDGRVGASPAPVKEFP